jgi:hypothetical protein
MRKYTLATLCYCLLLAGAIVPAHGSTISQCLLMKGGRVACEGLEGETRCIKFCQFYNKGKIGSADIKRSWLEDCLPVPSCKCLCKVHPPAVVK